MEYLSNENRILIEKNMQNERDFYRGNRDLSLKIFWDGEPGVTQAEAICDMEKTFLSQLSLVDLRLSHVREGYDNVPVVSFCGDIAYLYSLCYGCQMQQQGNLVISQPMYASADEAAGFSHLENPEERGLYPTIFRYIEEFQKRYGDFPITVSDTQSPVDVFHLLFPVDEAMFALYDEPVLSHRILDSITRTIIRIDRLFEEKIHWFAGYYGGQYLPYGIHLSDDDAAYLSPEIYQEFALPYASRLSREFGGVHFHVCMGFEQNLHNLTAVEGFIGFDAMPDYNRPEKIVQALSGYAHPTWTVSNFEWTRSREEHTDDLTYFKTHLDTARENGIKLELNIYDSDRDQALFLGEKVRRYARETGWML